MSDMDFVNRPLRDHCRLLWRDDVEGRCDDPDLCFENGEVVRCSPCAIAQSAANGVQVLNPGQSYLPEVCKLNREIERLRKERDGLRVALHEIDVLASNTIPSDGAEAAQSTLCEIITLINPHRQARKDET